MNTAVLIYPNQLFETFPIKLINKNIFIVEDPLFFGDEKYPLSFHKQKLILHRASMKYYEKLLLEKGIKANYIDYSDTKKLYKILSQKSIGLIETLEPVDFILKKRLVQIASEHNIQIKFFDNPLFLTTTRELDQYKSSQKRPFFQANFYKWQRIRLNILVDKEKNPSGGKWSFDDENRKKLPKSIQLPFEERIIENPFVEEAKIYVQKFFSNNPGSIDFNFPTTHLESKKLFESFLEEKFSNFGTFEDAISKESNTLFHSLLSSSLNTGLISPEYVVQKGMEFAKKNDVPINSLEGFLRQIIGWREYIRFVYDEKGVSQRNSNYFGHKNKLNKRFYNGTFGIRPVDDVINSLNSNAYSHHITRLMILGNFFLLIELDPTEVYKWFMEMYIDSYDWVMVPNVYGMSQFSDGGSIVTKPYFSGSNYIKKMSDYKGNELPLNSEGQDILQNISSELNLLVEWGDIWDGLFWRFVLKNKEKLRTNSRIGLLVKNAEKYTDKIHLANTFIKEIFK